MEAQLELIREQQKDSWNKFSPGWKKWDELTMDFLKPMGDEIIRKLKPKDGEVVLDIAAGTGEPGLTIASMIKNGRVIITDLAEGMLAVARENAALRNLDNVQTQICDVSEIPFPDNTFDAISCRFGFMFFPDMLLAAKEMHRVLKPGGRIAVAVWNEPSKNFWITATTGTISRNLDLPPVPPDAPGMFRCGGPGFMADLFEKAGFRNISEVQVQSKLKCGTTDNYWSFVTEVAASVVAALGKADEKTYAKIKREVFELVNQKYPGERKEMDANALVIYGEK